MEEACRHTFVSMGFGREGFGTDDWTGLPVGAPRIRTVELDRNGFSSIQCHPWCAHSKSVILSGSRRRNGRQGSRKRRSSRSSSRGKALRGRPPQRARRRRSDAAGRTAEPTGAWTVPRQQTIHRWPGGRAAASAASQANERGFNTQGPVLSRRQADSRRTSIQSHDGIGWPRQRTQ